MQCIDTGGAGDQGIVIGYACNHNTEMVPQEFYLAKSLCNYLYEKYLVDGKTQITINNNLNKYQFLLTLIHEIAHHVTYQKFGRVQPHGKEWKTIFQHLMLPFLQPEIYPKHILPILANYLKNPKASTDADVKLSLAFKEFSKETGKNFIFEVPYGSLFVFKKTIYQRGKKRRTRIECLNTMNKKVYLFNQNVEVTIYEE